MSIKHTWAVIDMGTNTFHLLVSCYHEGKLTHLVQLKEPVRLGKGGINQGFITEEAMSRAVLTLDYFKETCTQYNVSRIEAIATSAVRNASNGREFVERVEKQTGIRTRVVSGEEEASLIFEGVRHSFDLGEEYSLVLDIGGGSVEFIIGNRLGPVWKESIEIGGQRLIELFFDHDPIGEIRMAELKAYADERLSSLWNALQKFPVRQLVGSSGTFDTLSEIHIHKHHLNIDPRTLSTYAFSPEEFHEMSAQIKQANRIERMAIPGMIELRVDMIVVALVLIDLILEKNPVDKIKTSFFALKEGVLFKNLEKVQ
jgi:exopolyphosphatase/guanosine-5'-triphosphate,3'-diphosphate pyrophosphatase